VASEERRSLRILYVSAGGIEVASRGVHLLVVPIPISLLPSGDLPGGVLGDERVRRGRARRTLQTAIIG
jgi:hypothetical protein